LYNALIERALRLDAETTIARTPALRGIKRLQCRAAREAAAAVIAKDIKRLTRTDHIAREAFIAAMPLLGITRKTLQAWVA
jgi:hypothetical protein